MAVGRLARVGGRGAICKGLRRQRSGHDLGGMRDGGKAGGARLWVLVACCRSRPPVAHPRGVRAWARLQRRRRRRRQRRASRGYLLMGGCFENGWVCSSVTAALRGLCSSSSRCDKRRGDAPRVRRCLQSWRAAHPRACGCAFAGPCSDGRHAARGPYAGDAAAGAVKGVWLVHTPNAAPPAGWPAAVGPRRARACCSRGCAAARVAQAR